MSLRCMNEVFSSGVLMAYSAVRTPPASQEPPP